MRIAIATDRDCVASHFGCSPICTIADVEDGHIERTLVIPNPGCNPAFWADLFVRNSVGHVIAGTMGSPTESVLRGRGIHVLLGVRGDIGDVVERFTRGELKERTQDADRTDLCGECGT